MDRKIDNPKSLFLNRMNCYSLNHAYENVTLLYNEARKSFINVNSSKARGERITPEYVSSLPMTKRERHPRKCKKDAFNYKTNSALPQTPKPVLSRHSIRVDYSATPKHFYGTKHVLTRLPLYADSDSETGSNEDPFVTPESSPIRYL